MITSKEQAYQILSQYGIQPPPHVVYKNSLLGMPLQEFLGSQCYLEKNQLMPRWPHVDLILDLMFYPEKYGLPHFYTKLYSTIKKSIKTTLGSVISRWVAETWPGQQEQIFLASDAEQSKGRGYKAFRETIEKHPRWNKDKRTLYGPNGEELWYINDKHALYLPDNSELKPVSSDYAGEAGGNPTATYYTELWTWRLEKEELLYTEMTVPPTRPRGFRFIDTYAGHTGVSNILWRIWQRLVHDGKRLTIDEVPAWHNLFPDEFELPIYIDIPSRTIGYIDQGIKARRFPWQQGEIGEAYYQQERASALSEAEYLRLNENIWAEPTQALMPIQWYDNCLDQSLEPLSGESKKPVVVGCDASMTHDCTAMVVNSRHPQIHTDTVLREEAVWDPRDGGEINYDRTILPQLVQWHRKYIIVEVTYDKYQLKYLMDRVAEGKAKNIEMPDGSIVDLPALPVRSFNQNNERRESDSMLVTMTRDRHHWHGNNIVHMRNHILNAAARVDAHENTKLHIEKRDDDHPIDLVVADSMANKECLELGI